LPESVAASAVELGVRELGGAEGKRALLFGAGKMSELAARDLRERGAEVVISATRCPYPILHAEAVRPREKPLVLVDVAVPRDLDPAIGELEGCTLFD